MPAGPHPPSPIRIIVLAAPSGSGKTTIARRLLEAIPNLQFSISATTRDRRAGELHGRDYYFLSVDDFEREVARDAFVEHEEVYPGISYGTLRSEIDRIATSGAALLDVDVKGGMSVKGIYGEDALTLFIRPPSLDVLAERLRLRGTETEESLAARLERAAEEITYADRFDAVIVNDQLDEAVAETIRRVRSFLDVAATNS